MMRRTVSSGSAAMMRSRRFSPTAFCCIVSEAFIVWNPLWLTGIPHGPCPSLQMDRRDRLRKILLQAVEDGRSLAGAASPAHQQPRLLGSEPLPLHLRACHTS